MQAQRPRTNLNSPDPNGDTMESRREPVADDKLRAFVKTFYARRAVKLSFANYSYLVIPERARAIGERKGNDGTEQQQCRRHH